jgi:hypothetical protein
MNFVIESKVHYAHTLDLWQADTDIVNAPVDTYRYRETGEPADSVRSAARVAESDSQAAELLGLSAVCTVALCLRSW